MGQGSEILVDDDVHAMAPSPRRERGSWWQSLLVVALTTAVLSFAIPQAVNVYILAAFSQAPEFLLWLIPGWAIACTLTLAATRVSGRLRWIGAVVAPSVAAAVVAMYVMRGGPFPYDWISVPLPSWVAVLIAALAALTLGLFLSPWWMRAVGAIALIAASVFVFVPAIQESWLAWEQKAQDEAADERELRELAEREESFENYIAQSLPPAVAAGEGVVIDSVLVSAQFTTTYFVTASGAAITTIVDGTGTWNTNDAYPCWILADETTPFDTADSLADLSSWCVRDETGWRRPDGTGAARVIDDRLVVVRPARANEIAGPRATSPGDVSEVAASLRFLTSTEFAAAAREGYFAPSKPPV
jgi:hypothetical protein